MQVVVKTPHIRVDGEVTDDLVDYLRRRFGEIEVIDDDDDELVSVRCLRREVHLTNPVKNDFYVWLRDCLDAELAGRSW